MEFISISKKHSLASSVAHIFLNILLVVASWLSIYIIKTPFVAIGLILISKWRTFAVRPRYWIVNIKANLVDMIFSLSMVVLMFSIGVEYWASQALLILLFLLWIILIKPRSGKFWYMTQSLMSVFFGLAGILSIGYGWDGVVIAAFAFLIGYSSLRHILSNSEHDNVEILSLCWGLLFAQFIWVANYLIIGYSLSIGSGLLVIVPQISIIASILSLVVFDILSEIQKDDFSMKKFKVPILFAVAVCFVLLIGFSRIPQ